MLHNFLFKKEDIDQVFENLASEYIELGGTKRVDIYLVETTNSDTGCYLF